MMPTFLNQLIKLHAFKAGERPKNHLSRVWHGDNVAGFWFHAVMIHSTSGTSHVPMRVHGVTVDARHVFQMIEAVHSYPDRVIYKGGTQSYCHTLINHDTGRPVSIYAGAGAFTRGDLVASVEPQSEWQPAWTGVDMAEGEAR
jgi:hypothetical protein